MSARDCRATPACGTSRQTAHVSSVSTSVNVALQYCSIEHLSAAELVVGTEIHDTFERSNKTFACYVYHSPAFSSPTFSGPAF